MSLGNDIAGSKVWVDVPPPARVTRAPQINTKPDESEAAFPELFRACETQLCDLSMADFPWFLWNRELVKEQKLDPFLKDLLDTVSETEEVGNPSHCFFLQKEVVLRKRVTQWEHFIGGRIYQLVVPQTFCNVVLKITHEWLLRHFSWPHLKKDVSAYIRSCHWCQLIGKPDQKLKPVPLRAIPAISQPSDQRLCAPFAPC